MVAASRRWEKLNGSKDARHVSGGTSKERRRCRAHRPGSAWMRTAIEEHAARRYTRRGSRQRRKRLLYGFLSAVVVSGGVGMYMGLQSHTTLEEVRAKEAAAAAGPAGSGELSSVLNKAMMELWKVEDVECQRNRR